MIIRAASTNDLEAVARIHRDSILELCKTHYSPEQLADWTSALRPAAYVALLSSHHMFVADASGELAGFGVLDPNTGLVNATYVSPRAVGRGIGRALLEAMEADAMKGGFGQTCLNATLNAVGFYERLGYVSHGVDRNRLPSGVELPCVSMRKSLRGI
jgi:putative acetyltransferase